MTDKKAVRTSNFIWALLVLLLLAVVLIVNVSLTLETWLLVSLNITFAAAFSLMLYFYISEKKENKTQQK